MTIVLWTISLVCLIASYVLLMWSMKKKDKTISALREELKRQETELKFWRDRVLSYRALLGVEEKKDDWMPFVGGDKDG